MESNDLFGRQLAVGTGSSRLIPDGQSYTFSRDNWPTPAIPISSLSQGAIRRIQITRTATSLDNKHADDSLLHSQTPVLHETRNELLNIAKALGADMQRNVFLGKEASSANVRRANLMDRQVVT